MLNVNLSAGKTMPALETREALIAHAIDMLHHSFTPFGSPSSVHSLRPNNSKKRKASPQNIIRKRITPYHIRLTSELNKNKANEMANVMNLLGAQTKEGLFWQ